MVSRISVRKTGRKKTHDAERATPDLWEVRELADFNIGAASGEKPEMLEKSEIVIIDGKPVFR